jgi:hypothetical protein
MKALRAVLKVRFKEVGLHRIEKENLPFRKWLLREISISWWDHCFRPGLKVNMSMIFDLSLRNKDNSCPVCGFMNPGSSDTEIEWYDEL